jgi:hypothetical protein
MATLLIPCCASVFGAAEVLVWELPIGQEVRMDKRDGWTAAVAGSAFAGGAAVENDKLVAVLRPDAAGLTIYSKRQGSTVKVSVGLVGTDGSKEKIGKITPAGGEAAGKSEKTLGFSAGAAMAQVKLKWGAPFVEIKPVNDARAVDVNAGSRYLLLPDFFAMDVVFDAKRVKGEKLTVVADNFYLTPAGKDALVMCIWPGAQARKETAAEEKKQVSPEKEQAQEDRDAGSVEFSLSGEGEARKFNEGRIEFGGSQAVYVAVLTGENYWHVEDVSTWPAGKPTKIEWQRPFDAKWRATFFGKEGKRCAWGVSILSFYLPYYPGKEKVAKGYYFDETLNSGLSWRNGELPDGASQGLGHYIHPCWFKDKDTNLCLYVHDSERRAAADYNNMEKRLAEKAKLDGRSYIIYTHTVPNVFETAFIYPMDRNKDTPMNMITPVDVFRDTLGVGRCEYVLDREGLRWAFHGGEKKMHFEGATCGNWDTHLAPRLGKWQQATGRLDDKQMEEILWLIEDMGTFTAAVNKRVHTYQDFLDKVKELCEEARQKSPKTAELANAILNCTKDMENVLRGLPGFDKQLIDWTKQLEAYAAEVKTAEKYDKKFLQIGNIRSFAEAQDNTIAGARRCVNMIRQETGLAAAQATPEAATLAAAVRNECRKILRNPHPLEHF